MNKGLYGSERAMKEIDLLEVIGFLWKKRLFLLLCGGVALVMGVVVAYSIPKEFTTVVKLTPETDGGGKKMSGLGGLAAMAGVSLNQSLGMDAISPELYPDVVHSTPFLLDLFPIPVSRERGEAFSSFYEYMVHGQECAWWEVVFKLPFEGMRLLKKDRERLSEEEDGEDFIRLNDQQQTVLKQLRQLIGVKVDKKTWVVTLSVRMQDPVIAAKMSKVVLEKLQEYIVVYRIRKVQADLEFTQKVFKEARSAYYKAQQAYAAFEDANRNSISSAYRTEQERLKNEVTLAFNVYNVLAQKLEQDRIRVQEQTPVYAVIEPPQFPLTASSPKKRWIIVGSFFLGLIAGVGWLFSYPRFSKKSI